MHNNDSTKAHLYYPLYSIPLSTTVYIDYNLWYTHYGFCVRLRQVQCKQGHFLCYSLLGMLAKHSKSWRRNEA